MNVLEELDKAEVSFYEEKKLKFVLVFLWLSFAR
jgi:hypothetical protein